MEANRPKWYKEEELRLVEEWDNTETDETLSEFVLNHASERYLAERERIRKRDEYFLSRGIICN